MKRLVLEVANQWTIMLTQVMDLVWASVKKVMENAEHLTICDILTILLLELQINPTSASQASCFKIRTPVNFGALFLKFESTEDHCSYSAVRSGVRLR
jgi:hypothetical protein